MDRGTVLLLACLNVVAIAALFQRFGPGTVHDFGGVGIKVAEWFNSIGDSVVSQGSPAKPESSNAQISPQRVLPSCGTLTPSANNNFILFSQRVVLPGGMVGPAAVHVQDGIITKVQKGANLAQFSSGTNIHILDSVISPGVIDVHVHLNEPGRVEWEGITSGTSAAAAGGITTVVDMPLNSDPVTTSVEQLLIKQKLAQAKARVNVGHWAGLVPGNAADHGVLESLLQHGALGFKAFMSPSGIDDFPHVTSVDLAAALPLIKRKGAVLYVHAEVVSSVERREDADPTQFSTFLENRPESFELAAVSLLIQLLDSDTTPAAPGFKLHIAHLAHAGCLPLIQAAQVRHPITVETCPQYLNFHSEGVPDGATLLACMPPIRGLANQDELLAAVADGRINLVASDHSPAPGSMKQLDTGNFMKAWGGISGLQYLLPATWTPLRQSISLSRLTDLLSTAPAALAGLSDRKGKIAAGFDADIMVWDPEALTDTSAESEQHKCKLSPYKGTQLYGKVLMTIVKGVVVFRDGLQFSEAVCGHVLRKTEPMA